MDYETSSKVFLDCEELFALRELTQPLFKYNIGNDENVFFWLDNGHPLGPLFQRFGDNLVRNVAPFWPRFLLLLGMERGDGLDPGICLFNIVAHVPLDLRHNVNNYNSVT